MIISLFVILAGRNPAYLSRTDQAAGKFRAQVLVHDHQDPVLGGVRDCALVTASAEHRAAPLHGEALHDHG
jgi:hypothetical protein